MSGGEIRTQVYEPITCPYCHTPKPWVIYTKPGMREYECSRVSCSARFKVRILSAPPGA